MADDDFLLDAPRPLIEALIRMAEQPVDEEVIPGHILNLICAVHLRQDHGYRAWTIARFEARFPGLRTGDGAFGFTALHVLHHTRAASLARTGLGVSAER